MMKEFSKLKVSTYFYKTKILVMLKNVIKKQCINVLPARCWLNSFSLLFSTTTAEDRIGFLVV